MDYRALLKKYMEYVGNCEGTDFLDRNRRGFFTTEDWTALIVLQDEMNDEYNKAYAEPISV